MSYLFQAGCGQASILWARRPVEEVLNDPATTPEIKKKLKHVEEVRRFAERHLGLNVNKTFTQYSSIPRDHVAYNVTAAKELALEARTWWFPIVGRVPYLGFFKRADAETLASELQAQGWDSKVQDVTAYSTLGWFDDPLISSQMRLPETYLTGLIIHESAHATLWFKGDVDFNESFASFVEEEGSLEYYAEKEGPDSPILKRRAMRKDEVKRITQIFRKTTGALDALYKSSADDATKRREKARIISDMKMEFKRRAGEFQTLRLEAYADSTYNNADFLAYRRYESGSDFFKDEFTKNGKDWTRFFNAMKALDAKSASERRALLDQSPAAK
ncbi:MAG: aminopeptidase [Spirochaetia bacterium]|nr:aminopeptidase [Spirochaetia bacterium]